MITCGWVTAVTLQQTYEYTGKAYVLGSPSLAAELSQAGVTAVGIGVSIPFYFVLYILKLEIFILVNYLQAKEKKRKERASDLNDSNYQSGIFQIAKQMVTESQDTKGSNCLKGVLCWYQHVL